MKKALQQLTRGIEQYAHNKYVVSIVTLLFIVLVPILLMGILLGLYRGKIYPQIFVTDLNVGGQPFGEAVASIEQLQRDFVTKDTITVTIPEAATTSGQVRDSFQLSSVKVTYNPRETAAQAYLIGREESLLENLKTFFVLLNQPQTVNHLFTYDQTTVTEYFDQLNQNYSQPGAKPEIRISEINEIEIFKGENGKVLDHSSFDSQLHNRLSTLDSTPINLGFIEQNNQITEAQAQDAHARARGFLGKSLTLELKEDEQQWELSDKQLIQFLGFDSAFNTDKISEYLTGLTDSVNRPPQNGLFTFQDGKVTEFAPSKDGLTLNVEKSVENLIAGLSQLEATASVEPILIAADATPPEVTTAEVNDLGIKELLGVGTSSYRGSIAGRVHNVALTASRLHGHIIAPGETFSFNETIGEISRATGYQSAYVIQNGRTVLGDGGGVCQDSTTLFRAVMDAGLPITERKAHSYRVGYYEQNSQPGYDATVFSPTVDFKFTNDTPGHVLIQASADTKNLTLTIELYGTSDGRVATISNYQQYDAVPAPPPLYQDDPTLPNGTVKQVDWAAAGLKVKFDYTVTRGDETIFEKTYYSIYRPWQAVYLRGTGA